MSIITDALIMQMAKEFDGPVLILPGIPGKRKKTRKEIFEDEFLTKTKKTTTDEVRVVPRYAVDPTPG